MQKLLVATGNPGKFQEISAFLAGLPLKILSLQDVQMDHSGVVEDGETFAENAYIKADYFAKQTGLMTLAEDSGIIVKALENELGIKTRRWGAGEKATDQEWIDYFLDRMKESKDRGAKFIAHACLMDEKGRVLKTAEGEIAGKITESLQASIKPGIPLSSCFIPRGRNIVHSKLAIEEKNKISHRGKAISQIRTYLQTFLNKQKIC